MAISASPISTGTKWLARSIGTPAPAITIPEQREKRVPKRLTAAPARSVVKIDGRNTR